MSVFNGVDESRSSAWLTRYYATRAIFSVIWVALAFALGRTVSPLSIVLLLAYPAWDAVANYRDGTRNGGLRANPTQALNVVVSTVVTVAAAGAFAADARLVLYVFGAWAFLTGVLQLATGFRRWRQVGAQWPMILSGLQSAVAGALMTKRAFAGVTATPIDIAIYAAFGAFYFLLSAIWLAVSERFSPARFANSTPPPTPAPRR